MCPLFVSNQQPHTHVSIAGQQPTSTHSCLHCRPAPNQHTPMSPLLASTQPAHTNVSIAGQQPASTHPCLHCFPALMKIPRVVPQNSKIGPLTKVTWPPVCPLFSLYYGARTAYCFPGRRFWGLTRPNCSSFCSGLCSCSVAQTE